MKILTSVKDILQMARDDSFSGYTAERLVQDFNELATLREAGEKMAERLRHLEKLESVLQSSKVLNAAAIAEWEAANK